MTNTDFLAELEAEERAEAERLRADQKARRAALTPAATLATQISALRAEFLVRDAELRAELEAALREAKRKGAPASHLAVLSRPPLTESKSGGARGRAAARPRTKKKDREAPAEAALTAVSESPGALTQVVHSA